MLQILMAVFVGGRICLEAKWGWRTTPGTCGCARTAWVWGCARTRWGRGARAPGFLSPQGVGGGETDGGARTPREYGGREPPPYAYAVLESMEFRAERVGTGGSPPSQAGTKIQSLEKK